MTLRSKKVFDPNRPSINRRLFLKAGGFTTALGILIGPKLRATKKYSAVPPNPQFSRRRSHDSYLSGSLQHARGAK